MSNDPVEPSAEVRASAHQLREIFVALIAEGFTKDEAVAIIGKIVSAGIQGQQ